MPSLGYGYGAVRGSAWRTAGRSREGSLSHLPCALAGWEFPEISRMTLVSRLTCNSYRIT
jgi:hypothetical protein